MSITLKRTSDLKGDLNLQELTKRETLVLIAFGIIYDIGTPYFPKRVIN